jgi:peroxiredoxin
MHRIIVKGILPALLLTAVLPVVPAGAQPVPVEQAMPDFTLPVLQGGTWQLSAQKGKRVLLVFPRGLAGQGWCHICNYQYAELAELEQQGALRQRYNLEVVFVLPYDRAKVEDWVAKFPAQLTDIQNWKNPENQAALDERGRSRMERYRALFPKEYRYQEGQVPTPFPILIDADHALSQRLGLFTENWNGAQAPQNIPTLFLLDGEGVVRFKYHSQTTVDRPSAAYLVRILQRLMNDR